MFDANKHRKKWNQIKAECETFSSHNSSDDEDVIMQLIRQIPELLSTYVFNPSDRSDAWPLEEKFESSTDCVTSWLSEETQSSTEECKARRITNVSMCLIFRLCWHKTSGTQMSSGIVRRWL